jgi:copper chaperone CopZ
MTHTYQIEGMHCNSCVSKVIEELTKLSDVTKAEVQLSSPQATITMQQHISDETLQRAVANAGTFTIKEADNGVNSFTAKQEPVNWLVTYKPLVLVFAFITGIAFLTGWQGDDFNGIRWMNNFMAGFFITFSFFKFLDLRGFADNYSTYDLLAKKVYRYGFVYPFIELGLGIAYLTSLQPFYTNILTLLVMGLSSIGVIQSVMNKRNISCACLGAVFNLPMSTVTIIEDLLMAGMALFSLLY